MIVVAYSIYDKKALTYFHPFYAPTDGSAIRSFRDLVEDTNTQMGRHPGDFAMYCVGEWDDQFGRFEPHSPLRHVIDASALVPQVKPEEMPLFRRNGVSVPPEEAIVPSKLAK